MLFSYRVVLSFSALLKFVKLTKSNCGSSDVLLSLALHPFARHQRQRSVHKRTLLFLSEMLRKR